MTKVKLRVRAVHDMRKVAHGGAVGDLPLGALSVLGKQSLLTLSLVRRHVRGCVQVTKSKSSTKCKSATDAKAKRHELRLANLVRNETTLARSKEMSTQRVASL